MIRLLENPIIQYTLICLVMFFSVFAAGATLNFVVWGL